MADPFLEECHTGSLTQCSFYTKITWSCVLLVLVNTLIHLHILYWFEDKISQFSPSVLFDCFWSGFFVILSWRQDRHGIILSPTHLFSKKFWQPFPFTWNISSKDLENVSSYSLSNVVILETLIIFLTFNQKTTCSNQYPYFYQILSKYWAYAIHNWKR